MSIRHACDACGSVVEGVDLHAFGTAFIHHVRSAHSDWPYPDPAIRNYAEATQRLSPLEARRPDIGPVSVELVTQERLDDLLSFFDHDAFAGNPAWAACYCTEPHLLEPDQAPEDREAMPWQWYRQAMAEFMQSGRVYGYLAYAEDRPAGWVNASLRADYALYRQGPSADPPDDRVIGVSCFVIAPPFRHHGLAAVLLDRVIEDAPGRAAAWVEAYPLTAAGEDDATNFRGPRSLLQSRGFEPAEERDRYTVMRRRV